MERSFLFDPEQLPASNLHAGQIEELQRLNDRLCLIEQKIMDQAAEVRRFHQDMRMTDSISVASLQLKASVSFYLKLDDPLYDLENNIEMTTLYEYLESFAALDAPFGLCDGVNHNEFQHFPDHPLRQQHHCWLFHCLYDHTKLGWINILRIGEMELELVATFSTNH